MGPLLFLLFIIYQVLAICPANVVSHCNDGNNVDGDGCDSTCQIEDGWRCPANETMGPCVCYCVLPQLECGCNWLATGGGSPLPDMPAFERLGFAFQPHQRSEWIMQGFKFVRSGCNRASYWFDKVGAPACFGSGTPDTEGLTMRVAVVPSSTVDYDPTKVTYVNWVGSPIRTVSHLERLAWECPPGKVPTALYFERAGCHSDSNLSTYAWIDKKTAEEFPACLANSQNFNEGLAWVAECRPDPSLAPGKWMWIDAGHASPVGTPADLVNMGGLCPAGYAMTGAYFNTQGCGDNARWSELIPKSDIGPKCPLFSVVNGTRQYSGLSLRLKCTRFGEQVFECGGMAEHDEAPCDVHAQCVEVLDGTRCICKKGYEGEGRAGTCKPINVCKNDPNACPPAPGGFCTSTGPGTYTCGCNQGYSSNDNYQTCRAQLKPVPSSSLISTFGATCLFGGREGNITGMIYFRVQGNSQGDPVATRVTIRLNGNDVSRVTRWDIRTSSVDTGFPDLNSCWAAGEPYLDGTVNGFTLKYGKLQKQMDFIDPDVKLTGPTSILGRSIVLEEQDGDYIGCCTIHIARNDTTSVAGNPTPPLRQPTDSGAVCQFFDGRTVFLTQNQEYIGSPNGGAEDSLTDVPPGTTVSVNPEVIDIDTTFTSLLDTNKFKQYPSLSALALKSCGSGDAPVLAALPRNYVDYQIPTNRLFRSIRIRGTLYFYGQWTGQLFRIEVITSNPDLALTAWSTLRTSSGVCGTATPVTFNVVVPLEKLRDSITIRFSNTATGTQEWGLGSFKVTLDPVVETTVVRAVDFSGDSDLSSWTKLSSSVPPIRTPPEVGGCTVGGTTYNLLGGFMAMNTGEILEFKPTKPSPTFTRLNVQFTFWFLKNWQGQTARVEMYRLVPPSTVPAETIPMWTQTFTQNPSSPIQCGGTGDKDSFINVNVTSTFIRSTDQPFIRIFVTGPALSTASWAISSWTVNYLPPETSIDLYQNRFRNADGTYWTVAGQPVQAFTMCDGTSVTRGAGTYRDRALQGGSSRRVQFRKSSPRPFRKAIITFDFYFLDTWDDEEAFMNVDGINGKVWSKRWSQNRYVYTGRLRCQASTTYRSYFIPSIAVPVEFSTDQRSIVITWDSTLNSALADESFAIGALRVTIFPDASQVLTTFRDGNNLPTLTHAAYYSYPPGPFSGITSGLRNTFTTRTPATATCTLPAWENPGAGTMHNLIGYNTGYNQAIINNGETLPENRPYTKAFVEFQFWWLDNWRGELGYVRHVARNAIQAGSPCRYLFLESFSVAESYTNFCGNGPNDGTSSKAFLLLERDATFLAPQLVWGSTLIYPDQSLATSRIKISYFPEVPFRQVFYAPPETQAIPFPQMKWFNRNGAQQRLRFATFCSGVPNVIWGGGSDERLELVYPPLGTTSEPFTQVRVFFRYWFFGTWEGERGTLKMVSDSGELVNIWRMDWRQQPDPASGFDFYSICSTYPVSRFVYRDWYSDVFVEGTFTKPTTSVNFIWESTLNQGGSDEAFGLSHVLVQIVPVVTGGLVETTSFQSTGDSLVGWSATIKGIQSVPPVTKCGKNSIAYLVGGRTRLTLADSLTYTNRDTIEYAYTVAHIYFRFWFLPSWNGNELVTVKVFEPDRPTNVFTQTFPYPFDLNDPAIKAGSLDCSTDLPYGRDFSMKATLPRLATTKAISVQFYFTQSGSTATAKFAVSAFHLEVEKPSPDWYIQSSCVGAVYAPADGNEFNLPGSINYGLGQMTNKHGVFVTKNFVDNTVRLNGPFNVIGKTIALYQREQFPNNPTCCRVVATGPLSTPPPAAPARTAGCVWRNKDTEGWVSFRTPSQTGVGTTLIIKAKFFGNQVSGPHGYTLNARGFGLPEVSPALGRCPQSATGDIYGTGQLPDDFIGPSSAGYALGNPPFPGAPGSSRARIGDLSSKYGKLPGVMVEPFVIEAGQISLSGPLTVVGRSFVVLSTTGTPLGCCTIGFGPVGMSSDPGPDYFDYLKNFTQPQAPDFPIVQPEKIPDPTEFGKLSEKEAETFGQWTAGKIALLVVGLFALGLTIAAIVVFVTGAGAGTFAAAPEIKFNDEGSYVAM